MARRCGLNPCFKRGHSWTKKDFDGRDRELQGNRPSEGRSRAKVPGSGQIYPRRCWQDWPAGDAWRRTLNISPGRRERQMPQTGRLGCGNRTKPAKCAGDAETNLAPKKGPPARRNPKKGQQDQIILRTAYNIALAIWRLGNITPGFRTSVQLTTDRRITPGK